jgi:hypothetical protein
MSVPIKYSYSGADCKAVAFYSNVDDYARYSPKENDAFFTFTTTQASSSETEEIEISSALAYSILYTDDRKFINKHTIAAFDDALRGLPIDGRRSMQEGQRIRADLKSKYDARFPSQIPLDSLATISYSIYEAKSPVRRLGNRGVSGYTRGIRTIAGSMVFLVIEDHPLSSLIDLQRKSKNFSFDKNSKGHSYQIVHKQTAKRFVSTLLEPFNIGLFYKTEVAFRYKDKAEKDHSNRLPAMRDSANYRDVEKGYKRGYSEGAHLVISGIDIISEGMVTSVNDMVTEVTMQFVAQDVFNIEKTNFDNVNLSTD